LASAGDVGAPCGRCGADNRRRSRKSRPASGPTGIDDSAETDDNLPPGEGAFLACSFWLADAYVMLGRMDDARRLFERLLALRNDVGLLAEEYDTASRRQVGNFPQAFSHLALGNTAHNLTRMAKPADQRSESASMATA
jgi:hypothetical protein